VADQGGDGDHDRAAHDVGGLHRLQVQLLVHHRGQPGLAVGGDGAHHHFHAPIEFLSPEGSMGTSVKPAA